MMHPSADTVSQALPIPETEPVEPRSIRLRRHGHQARLYGAAFALVALLVALLALAAANTGNVKLHWVLGTSDASVLWIVIVTAVLGWLLGIATSVTFALRTRRRPAPRP
jgi:uncharacterized integral membrane protein